MTNQRFESIYNHIIAITYDGGEANIEDRLKISWTLEHEDTSNNTGITMFDFNNDGAFDLCYRDEETLRVISPKLGTTDYIRYTETEATSDAILFRTQVYSETGFEAPAIADVNMDGSADIIVAGWVNQGIYWANVYVFEYTAGSQMWAPCPPVWNQALYNPLYINEDLTVPAKPISMLTPFTTIKGGYAETITPYNGAWIQQPIVKEGEYYIPVYRHPDAVLTNMKVESDGGNTKIKIIVRNDGLASINSTTPIYFYHTVPATSTKLNAVVIPIGVDVFPNEKVELEYTISGSPVGLFTHCSLVNTGTGIPANGYTDCRPTNNEGYTSIIRAVDDYVIAFSDSTSFNVVANDTIVAGGNAILEIYEGPKKGIATVSGDKISYVPTGTIPYRDTLTYLLKCEYGGDTLASVDTAYVFIVVADYPDNIVDEELCYAPSPSIVFNVKQQWSATNRAHSNTGPLVGDLDGDGIPEIVTFDETMTILNVTNGADGALKTSLIIPYVPGTGGWFPVMTAALVDADANGRGEIILATSDLKLTSYEATVSGGVFSLTQKWQTTFVNISSAIDNTPQPIVTDLNGDGIPEVIVYNQIFNALTGSKLGETEAVASAYVGRNPHRVGNINSNFMTAADLDGDGMLEIVAGGKVYKPTFNASKTAVTCTILYQNTSIPDGYTAVADADMNGSLDVVVVSALSNGTTWLYVWSPTENRLIHGLQIYSNPTYNAQSYPFIGDIDGFVHPVTGKKYPEICVTIVGAVKAYKYDPIAGKYSEKWSLITTDASGGTGITLFDFNNDGINELVYRDQTLIRILNGITDNAEPVLADVTGSISCYSGTAFEYPVIADTDGDGSANICVTCSQGYEIAPHYLRTFESATEPWAPARNVWNQVNYEPLQINSNLTTPIYPIPKNIEFSGKYPYNGALIQVSTMVNTDFSVVQLAPDPSIQAMWTEITDDTIRVWVRIENLGVRNTNISLPVALYGVKTPPAIAGGASLIATKPVGVSLVPGDSCEVYFDVPIASMPPAFSVRIQDDGVNFPADGSYLDCNYGNNVSGLSFLMAIDDHVSLYEATLIDVLANDFFGDCERGGFLDIGLVASAGPTHGSVMINADSTLRYTPVANYIGVDSLDYYIKCGTDYDTATVFINIIEKPDNISDADCFVIPDPTEWTIKQSQTISAVSTYMPALTGDLDGDGLPEVVIGTDMNVSPYAPFNASHVGRKVKILHGGDFDSPTVFSTNMPYNPIMPGVIAIARVDVSGVETGIVVVAEGDLRLRAYDISGALLWTSSDYFTDSGNPAYTSVSVGFADFNNDGKAEVYCGNRIFDAATGVFKCKGTGNEGYTKHWGDKPLYSTIAADVTGDGRLELIAGNQIYKVAGDLSSMTIISTVTPPQCIENAGLIIDGEGATSVIDIDNDGDLEVLVRKIVNGYAFIYIWSPKKQAVLAQKLITVSTGHLNTPFIGDLDGNGKPEIVILAASPNNIYAYKYVSGQNLLSEFWSLSHSDNSGMTGVTLFDFNQDGISELVYRDETHLRIINGSKKSHITGNDTTAVYNLTSFTSRSGTGYEYPVVVDIDNDGASEILVAGGAPGAANGNLVIYKSAAAPWAPARKVWNQYLYNAVNVNEDLTIPKYQINPAIVFPGSDGILGTSHDVRPYNNFLQQQTVLSKNGTPLWLTPDVYPDPTLISSTVIGDSVSITIGIINKGDASIGSPVYVSLYKESISTANYMITDSTNIQVHPGDTGYVIVRIPDMSLYPAANIVVRVNDNGMTFTYQPECDDTNNTLTIQNPALSLYMEKDATLLLTPPVQHNGTLPNPVSVLFSENIKYEITAVNITGTTAPIQICDTLPAYLKYNTGSENPSTNFVKSVTASGVPVREILTWNVPGVAAGASTTVSFTATPVDGSCASQPLYINKAWITVGGLQIPTGNSTYHQGAGVGIATFSAGLGGQLYNAEPQAVDYRTAARSGVLVVPDDGYQFDGWSHEAYTSLRGDKIEARDGVMNYDTLTIFGNVELQAHFSLEAYPVHYYLNGADNAESNPETYTVKSGTLMLEAPEKIGDVFTGWTGSNGDKPQAVVTIPEGSTGELEFYANFLYSGRENDVPETELQEDKIWAAKSDVYVRTSKVGSMVRIYSIDGMLIRQQEIKTAGETKIQLPRGIYIVTLNNDIGKKIRID
ncbi:FG-GAP-like repeat-containing protein [Bacteroides sp. OttesenSCG-928-D19]|nr:FG-GAP-like repeat-containing protein [Bacteroides sp. OttesenSCG-928-D19]